jgi:hypothetical protein
MAPEVLGNYKVKLAPIVYFTSDVFSLGLTLLKINDPDLNI